MAYAKVLSREGNLVTVKMPSSEAGKVVGKSGGLMDVLDMPDMPDMASLCTGAFDS